MIQCYFLIKKINNNVINQIKIIHYKLTCFSKILKCCKSNQIFELCYQQQEKILKQKKYKYKQVNMIWNINLSD